MVAIKANEVERKIAKLDGSCRFFLLYGPDTGLTSERADRIAARTGVDLKDPFATVRLDADNVAEDRSRLLDEAFTVGMFGGERLLRITGATRRNLADCIKPLLEAPELDCWIILEAGDLDKRSALRTAVEKSPNGWALPSYQDEIGAIKQIIREELTELGFELSRDVEAELARYLGGDRLATRNELRKLTLYIGEPRPVTIDDIVAIIGDASALDVNDIIDAVASGDIERLEQNLDRILLEGMSPDMVLMGALRHFQLLHELRGKMDKSRLPAKSVVEGARPPIFYKRRPRIAGLLAKLDRTRIEKLLNRFQTASFEARANPELAPAIAGTNLLAATLEMRR